uniref:NADH-ubiquinone oxidoreductase chain 6 n=1 Tax=Ophiura luetkenii TaxID=869195 RepID=Q6Y402_OPHLU|nr:NADH dehydrogenase subunit 6 [Ophiura luetkenii]AAO65637.1 NADH dehydrogenase subunit 6 [Ophiura luetkenii]
MVELVVIAIFSGCLVLVFSGSPYFGLFGVLLQSIGFSLLLFLLGLPFFSLLTVLVYVGGMMIVFLFSTILSAERYPGSSWSEFLVFLFSICLLVIPSLSPWFLSARNVSMSSLSSELGFCEVFNSLGYFTCFLAFILLVALVVVLVISFEHSQSSLRKL